MLRTMAVLSMQHILYAVGLIVLFSLAALVFPPFSYIASGIIVLHTLGRGPKQGIAAIAASIVVFAIVASLLLDRLYLLYMVLLLSWLPVWGASLVLGYTRSLAASLLAAGAFGVLLVVAVYLFIPDPVSWWQQLITLFLDVMNQQAGLEMSSEDKQQLVNALSTMMTGWLAASIAINIVIGLFLGRSLQAKLYNPNGFATEFQQLRLGKSAAVITAILLIITIWPSASEALPILRECLPTVLVLFVLQGLAVVHAIVNQQQKSILWLVAIYVMLIVILPQMVIVLAVIGILEQWFNFRHRFLDDVSN